jgi:hypothetical protein
MILDVKLRLRSVLLFFFMLPIVATAQLKIENKTSITWFKGYNEPDDGPCNSYISKEGASIVSNKIIDCDDLVLELMNFKESLQKESYVESCCRRKGMMGCHSIENMLVLEFNKWIDTLYFSNKFEKKIIDFNLNREYNDTNDRLVKIISKSSQLKSFLNTDYEEIWRSYVLSEGDLISKDKIKINDKLVVGLSRKELDKLVGGFDFVSMESYGSNDGFSASWNTVYIAKKNSNEFHFTNDDKIEKIIIKDSVIKDIGLCSVLGINLSTSENEASKKFPNSYKQTIIQKKYFKQIDNTYSLDVGSHTKDAWVSYVFKDEKMIAIEISFNY